MITSLNITSSQFFNSKYAYNLGGTYGWVYWEPATSRWENRSALGSGTLYNYLLNTGSKPITTPLLQWVNVAPYKEVVGCFIGDCPDNVCFYGTWNTEDCIGDGYEISQNCASFKYAYPGGTDVNGNLFYVIDSPELAITPVYVWFNVDSGKWILGTVLEDLLSLQAELFSSDPFKPIGNWETDDVPAIWPFTSFVECTSTLCVNVTYTVIDDETATASLIYAPAGTHNGKPKYINFPDNDYVIYWSDNTNRWELGNVVNDTTPSAYLSYTGNQPLSGQLPGNAQWVTITSIPYISINYTSIGELESDEYGPHGPCYLPVCFLYGGGEAAGNDGLCTIPATGVYNGKPYYQITMPDCTTRFFDDPDYMFVYWDQSESKWVTVLTPEIGTPGEVLSELSSSTDDLYPVGTWEVTGNVKGFTTVASGLECPIPPQDICITFGNEATNINSCVTSASGSYNGRPYYQILDSTCDAPLISGGFGFWVYYDGIKWVIVAANGSNPDSFSNISIVAELTIDSLYPVGAWTILPPYDGDGFVALTVLNDVTITSPCNTPTLCLGLALGSDGGGFGPTNVSILGNTEYINGRPTYTFTTNDPNLITTTLYYNGTNWVYDYFDNGSSSPDPSYSFTIPGSTGLLFPPEYTAPGDPVDCNLSVPNALCSISYEECPL